MKPLFYKVRQRAACALTAAALLPLIAMGAPADPLDDAVAASMARAPAPLVPRTTMIQRQPIRDVRLSPDGRTLAYLRNSGKFQQLWVHDIDTRTDRKLMSSKTLESILWASDSRYIFMTSEQGVSVAPLDEDESPGFVMNLDRQLEDVFYGVDRGHPHAFFASKIADEGDDRILFRVEPDGRQTELYRSHHYLADFLTDETGTVRIVRRIRGAEFEVVYIEGDAERPLLTCSSDDACALYSYASQSRKFYMKGRLGADLASLYAVNPETGGRRLVHADPSGRFDLVSAVFDAGTGEPDMALYRDDHLATYGLNDRTEGIAARIESRLGAPYLALRPNADRTRWLVLDPGPGRPSTRYYLYDSETDVLWRPLEPLQQALSEETPLLPEAHAAQRVPVWYRVSDGMMQQGYVTLPNGVDPASVPLVVMPHGGPWNRTTATYNMGAQFLANRGYAVFEPNFRASTGLGRNYMVSANRDFGDGRVHQDILDGMIYVLSRGVGDPARLGIFGHSFGGFSALGALAFTPDLFQVGFAGAPPADLSDAIRFVAHSERGPQWQMRYENFKRLSVDPEDAEDVRRLHAQSPARHRQKLTKPLYIWAGEKDRRVSILDVRDYALRQHADGKPITFMVEPKAPHGPREELHREAYFYMLEKAFADHLGGRIDTSLSPALARYLKRTLVFDRNGLAPQAG